ncbi:hypothetical protein WH47_12293 [Habropoda laboriosa]|uniref:Histone-lysine N-methyltransferase SETMAR n=1 Tax=Habropoda laboriosa TaxID=597456 RepID=A0A0L7RAU5_9HYME|nr:hypothetical protein WH47_12293 [Habropoda laboriosa]
MQNRIWHKRCKKKLRRFNWNFLSHPPYSPEITSSDYHLFRALQRSFGGQIFDNIDSLRNSIGKYFHENLREFL